jgi:hypothetical protein
MDVIDSLKQYQRGERIQETSENSHRQVLEQSSILDPRPDVLRLYRTPPGRRLGTQDTIPSE